MKVIKYNTMLDNDRKTILVKEKSSYCKQVDTLNLPEKIVSLMNFTMQAEILAEERVWMLATNNKNKLIGIFEIAHGTINNCILQPREIFVRACICGAAHIFIVHNHPSGDPEPSEEDNRMTQRIAEVGKLIGIPLLDHIIIGNHQYYSYFEMNNKLL